MVNGGIRRLACNGLREASGMVQENAQSTVQVSGVLLAAGTSSRMDSSRPKQLLLFDGVPLVRRAVLNARSSLLNEVIVVVGHWAAQVRQALRNLDVRIVENPNYRAGQSTSVKAGLAAVAPTAQAALFMPIDQPYLTGDIIDRVILTYEKTRAPIVVPAYQQRRGAPVLFERSLFPELARITGDEGGRQLLQQHPDKIATVVLDSSLPLLDIDTSDVYHALQT